MEDLENGRKITPSDPIIESIAATSKDVEHFVESRTQSLLENYVPGRSDANHYGKEEIEKLFK